MPTANETVDNRPIDGDELKKILMAEFEKMLGRDAMFSKRLSYPRAAFRMRVQLFLPNPAYPVHTTETASANPAVNEKDEKKKLLTTPPKGQAGTLDREREMTIESPNLARLTHNLPITIQRRNPENGRIEDIPVEYNGEGAAEKYPDLNQAKQREVVEAW